MEVQQPEIEIWHFKVNYTVPMEYISWHHHYCIAAYEQ